MTTSDRAQLPARIAQVPAGGGAVQRLVDDVDEHLRRQRAEVVATLPSRITVAAGAWLLVAPFVLSYSPTAASFHAYWNDAAAGIALVFAGLLRLTLSGRATWLAALSAGLGGWLVAAPFVLGFAATGDALRATVNEVAVGILVVVLAVLSALAQRHRPQSG